MNGSVELVDRLDRGLKRLEGVLSGFPVRATHFIPDLVSVGFGREVFENGVAALQLARSDTPRAANACGRAAFEAVVDLMFLVSQEDYDYWGSRARAAELLDREHARDLFADVDYGVKGEAEAVAPFKATVLVAQDAEAWEGFCPGKGRILHDAFEAVQKDRAKRRWHWSGKRRSELPDDFVVQSDDRDATLAMIRSWYTLLSIETHPAPRIFTDHVDVDSSGRIRLKVTPDSAEERSKITAVGVGAGVVAAEMAAGILEDMAKKARDS